MRRSTSFRRRTSAYAGIEIHARWRCTQPGSQNPQTTPIGNSNEDAVTALATVEPPRASASPSGTCCPPIIPSMIGGLGATDCDGDRSRALVNFDRWAEEGCVHRNGILGRAERNCPSAGPICSRGRQGNRYGEDRLNLSSAVRIFVLEHYREADLFVPR